MSGENVPAHAPVGEAPVRLEMEMNPEASAETLTPLVVSVGQQLREVREARGLTVADVSKAIKLGPRQVVAIEADDWPSLPCTTIIRGFVRNYARLLELNPDLLMRALDISCEHSSGRQGRQAGVCQGAFRPDRSGNGRVGLLFFTSGRIELGFVCIESCNSIA
jgi:DNA-binding XRE family transcriptional regulator